MQASEISPASTDDLIIAKERDDPARQVADGVALMPGAYASAGVVDRLHAVQSSQRRRATGPHRTQWSIFVAEPFEEIDRLVPAVLGEDALPDLCRVVAKLYDLGAVGFLSKQTQVVG